MKVHVGTVPGKKSKLVLDRIKKINLGWNVPYPFVHSGKGSGCYFSDIDGNVFLDFASQISSNPLGYNDKNLNRVIKKYKKSPFKYAGQDFTIIEHVELIEELLSITKKNLNSAFLINSGAEANENAIKIAMRIRKKSKFGISFDNAFHGRTSGALSLTNSKVIQKKNFFTIPTKRLPYDETAKEKLQAMLNRDFSSEEIAFIIMEPVQGEGGYNFPDKKMVREIRDYAKTLGIPFIADEVQSGLGRSGKWWAMEHYNVTPDILSSAKALQVGAVVSNKKYVPETGSLSSTWGGGNIIDIAMGIEIIKKIKRKKLLNHINNVYSYKLKRLRELNLINVRGFGLMIAFDLPNRKITKDFIVESLKNGLVLLACGEKTIRVIPPYVVSKNNIDEGVDIIEKSLKNVTKRGFRHRGAICNFVECGENIT